MSDIYRQEGPYFDNERREYEGGGKNRNTKRAIEDTVLYVAMCLTFVCGTFSRMGAQRDEHERPQVVREKDKNWEKPGHQPIPPVQTVDSLRKPADVPSRFIDYRHLFLPSYPSAYPPDAQPKTIQSETKPIEFRIENR